MLRISLRAPSVAGVSCLAASVLLLAGRSAGAAAEELPPPPPPPPPLDSVTLLSPEPVPLFRNGVARVPLFCSAGRGCNGIVSLETPRPLRIGSRRKSSLGSVRFSVPAQDAITVDIRLSQRDARFARKAGDLRVVTVVEELDLAGRIRRSTIRTRLVARRG